MAGGAFTPEYAPRRADETILYQVVADRLETFLARARDRGRPPPRLAAFRGASQPRPAASAEDPNPRLAHRWRFGIVALLVVMGSHLLTGHVSEMYAHPVVAMLVLLGAAALPRVPDRRRLLAVAVASFLVTAAFVDFHKWREMRATGLRARAVARQIVDQWPMSDPPRRICSIRPEDDRPKGYSVFQAVPKTASCWGFSVFSQWGWTRPEVFLLRETREACFREGVDAIVRFDDDQTATLELTDPGIPHRR